MKRIAIVGMGAICGNGDSVDAIWKSLLAGKPTRTKISAATHFDLTPFEKACTPRGRALVDTVCASALTDDELAKRVGESASRYDRHQLFALVAAEEAMSQVGRPGEEFDATRIAISGGTGDGGLQESYLAHKRLFEGKPLMPTSNLRELPNVFLGYVAAKYGIKGPGYVHCTACAASQHALMHACDQIMLDRADMALVVGADASITPFGIASFAAQRAIANDSRPYRRDREGFLIGEGAAALVLEDFERAHARGANILATIDGWASTTDGSREGAITDPSPQGGERAARGALRMAGIDASKLGFVKTHGTGTPTGDAAELAGIRAWAGNDAARVWITATKSHTGHLLGAAGALEAVLCVQMLRERTALPTLGLTMDVLDPECDGFAHAMHVPGDVAEDFALANSFGFGGANGSIVFQRYEA